MGLDRRCVLDVDLFAEFHLASATPLHFPQFFALYPRTRCANRTTKHFLPDQLMETLLTFPLAVAGLSFYFFGRDDRRFRALGWMYVVPFLLLWIGNGRGYYLAPAYPMLYAVGASGLRQRLKTVAAALVHHDSRTHLVACRSIS